MKKITVIIILLFIFILVMSATGSKNGSSGNILLYTSADYTNATIDNSGGNLPDPDNPAPPVITSVNVADSEACSNTVITWVASNAKNRADISYQVNNGEWIKIGGLQFQPYTWNPGGITGVVNVSVTVYNWDGLSATGYSGNVEIKDNTPPVVEVKRPVSGYVWEEGTEQVIRWTAVDSCSGISSVNLSYIVDGVERSINTVQNNPESYTWTIPNFPSSNVQIVVNVTDNAGNSKVATSETFIIKSKAQSEFNLKITSPTESDTWKDDDEVTISWTYNTSLNLDPRFYIVLNVEEGNASIAETKEMSSKWTVKDITEGKAKIVVTAKDDNLNVLGFAESEIFSIVNKGNLSVHITHPVEKEIYTTGETKDITWYYTPEDANITGVSLEYSLDDGKTYTSIIKNEMHVKTYSWLVPKNITPSTDQGRIKIKLYSKDGNPPTDDDVSDAFRLNSTVPIIVPSVTVTDPKEGETLTGGTTKQINWTFKDFDGVTISGINVYYSENSNDWTQIKNISGSATNCEWTVPDKTTSATIRVQVIGYKTPVTGDSEKFNIKEVPKTPTVSIIAPNGGESLFVGKLFDILFETTNNSYIEGINLSYFNGNNWTQFTKQANTATRYTWQIPDYPTKDARVRVTIKDITTKEDISSTSNETFEIRKYPTVIVENPKKDDIWYVMSPNEIRWNTTDTKDITGIDLKYSTNSGINWNNIITNLSGTETKYSWTPNLSASSVLINVTVHESSGLSISNTSQRFKLTAPTITLKKPSGRWFTDSNMNISWTLTGADYISIISLEYLSAKTNNYVSIANLSPNITSYIWQVPDDPSDNSKIRATIYGLTNSPLDPVTADLVIRQPTVTVKAPSGSLNAGKSTYISWTLTGEDGIKSIDLYYKTDATNDTWTPVDGGIGLSKDLRRFSWTVPTVKTDNAVVNVSINGNYQFSASGISMKPFSIKTEAPKIQVNNPNGGEVFDGGNSTIIDWSVLSTGVKSIDVAYSIDSGKNFVDIAKDLPGTSTNCTFEIPEINTILGLVRVIAYDNYNGTASDDSDDVFEIITPTLKFTSPTSSSKWISGTNQPITWTLTGQPFVSGIDLLYYNGTWNPIPGGTGLASDKTSITWTIPKDPGKVKIRGILHCTSGITVSQETDEFSILVNSPVPKITYPKGGENLARDTFHPINWTAQADGGIKSISLSYQTGGEWIHITELGPTDTSYNWKTPNGSFNNVLVNLTVTDMYDQSAGAESGPFKVISPSISLTTPNGGEIWESGLTQTIKWKLTGSEVVSTIDLVYSTDSGKNWKTIEGGTNLSVTTTSFSWKIPSDVSRNARVFVTANCISNGQRFVVDDGSDADFTIKPRDPTITVTSPVVGDMFAINTTHEIKWIVTSDAPIISADLRFSLDGSTWTNIGTLNGSNESYFWLTPKTPGENAMVEVTIHDSFGSTATGRSGVFELYDNPPVVIVTYPNGGETLAANSTVNIRYNATDESGIDRIKLEYSVKGTLNWEEIAITKNTGSYLWNVPVKESEKCRVRVTAYDTNSNSAYDYSDNVFTIKIEPPTVKDVIMNGNHNCDGIDQIMWTATDEFLSPLSIDISYSVIGSSGSTVIATGLSNTGQYEWTVPPNPKDVTVTVTATNTAGVSKSGESSTFTIVDVTPPEITITAPTGGISIKRSSSFYIMWTATDNVGIKGVELWYKYGNNDYQKIIGNLMLNQYGWTVPGVTASDYYIKAIATDTSGNTKDAISGKFSVY